MAWYQGAWTATTAGLLLAVLDEYLPDNPFWSIHDASAGTNAKVYECQDDSINCHFFVKVDDNYSGYAIIELWEGWDATGHVGTGRSRTVFSSTYTFRIYRSATSGENNWFLSVQDHHFKFIKCGPAGFVGTYIGRPKLFDESQNIVVFCGESTTVGNTNTLAYYPDNASGGLCFLTAPSGGSFIGYLSAGASSSITRYGQTIFGQAILEETMIRDADIDYIALGYLEGVLVAGAYDVQIGRVYYIDGVPWLGVVGASGYASLVRMG